MLVPGGCWHRPRTDGFVFFKQEDTSGGPEARGERGGSFVGRPFFVLAGRNVLGDEPRTKALQSFAQSAAAPSVVATSEPLLWKRAVALQHG